MTEFLDTIFFVLRKRNRQVSFLHVYHHSVTMYFSWLFLKYTPSEQGAIVGLINSLVHVVMYTYYMIAAMGPAYQKYIWWKKYMTVIQLVSQFSISSSLVVSSFLRLVTFTPISLLNKARQFFAVLRHIFDHSTAFYGNFYSYYL